MNKEDELFKKCFMKTLKKLAEEPDEVINYNEQLKKYNNLLKEKIKLQQELQRKDNIIKSLISYLETQINDYKEMGYNQSKIREKDLWMAGQYDEDIFILDKIEELESK